MAEKKAGMTVQAARTAVCIDETPIRRQVGVGHGKVVTKAIDRNNLLKLRVKCYITAGVDPSRCSLGIRRVP
jgi:hypothetical protein